MSGIVGLAFPALTEEYTDSGARLSYNSLMQTIFEIREYHSLTSHVLETFLHTTFVPKCSTLILNLPATETYSPPLASRAFSIAISRDVAGDGYGGVFTIGGVPSSFLTDPTINVTSLSAYTFTPFSEYPSNFQGNVLSYYAISVDGFSISSSASTSSTGVTLLDPSTVVIIDSGANALILPKTAANEFNAAWTPPGHYSGFDYIVPCTATLNSTLGISVGGRVYPIGEPSDLMGRTTNQDGSIVCYSLVENGDAESGEEGRGMYIVGDPWPRNVLAVFDWGNSRFSVYGRTTYQS